MNRRDFMSRTSQATAALSLMGLYACNDAKKDKKKLEEVIKNSELFFKISLAEWSFHRSLKSGKMDNLDFAARSRSLGCEGVEYVNGFFKDKAKDMSYLKDMKLRADAEGQQNVLIMIDGEGSLADVNIKGRLKAIENHYKWVEAAHFLGCHAIRVNLAGGKDKADAVKAGVDSLSKLSEFAQGSNINVLVENHGGFSSNGEWMTDVFSQIKNKNCGTLPDFGNFCITKNKNKECLDAYDRYKGMKELLPFAKAVSAKSYDFDTDGNETTIDFYKMIEMVKDVNYNGFIGIEFEGHGMTEDKGISLTRDLLIKAGQKLS